MQNWKIKRMKDGEIKSNIEACHKFLGVYKKGRCMGGFNCLFCKVVENFHPRTFRKKRCFFCLWQIIESESCEDFANREFSRAAVDAKWDKDWPRARIPMLKRWKKILKAELKRRAEIGA